MVTLLDGPVGTELARRGVPTPLPLWSAAAIRGAPEVLAAIHADYAAAGATVHTANTFRTSPWALARVGREGEAGDLTHRAVAIARASVPSSHRIVGSMAPLEDCYRPDLSPPAEIALAAHRRMARLLADAGVDLLLCETFPHTGEALVALDAALETGLPVWLSFTAGPHGELLEDSAVFAAAGRAVAAGAAAVLVNCVRPARLQRMLPGLGGLGVPVGGYTNIGAPCAVAGWRAEGEDSPHRFAEVTLAHVDAGARIVGGCCGTTPAHIGAVAELLSTQRSGLA